jgi:hypothetical protein
MAKIVAELRLLESKAVPGEWIVSSPDHGEWASGPTPEQAAVDCLQKLDISGGSP